MLLHNELTWLATLLLCSRALFQVVPHFGIALAGSIILMIPFFNLVAYLTPLQRADVPYCRGEMSKTGAVAALIAIVTIIALTLYILLIKPMILTKPPFF